MSSRTIFTNMNTLQQILANISARVAAGDDDIELRRAIYTLAKTPTDEVKSYAMDMFAEYIDQPIRDAFAIIIGEMQVHESVPLLIEGLNFRKHSIGTIVSQLTDLDCEEHFILFVHMVANAVFEPRNHALTILENYYDTVPDAMRRYGIKILEKRKAELEGGEEINDKQNRLDFINGALEMLREVDEA